MLMERMRKALKNKKGFSLVELIVVIAILGVIAGIAVPNVIGYLDNAKKKADTANANVIANTIMVSIAEGTSYSGGYLIDSTTTNAVNTLLSSKLQKIPTPQYTTNKFVVYIDSSNKIAVGLGTEAPSAALTAKILYPAMSSDLSGY